MERREKTEFLIEQMRLLVALANAKDKQAGKDSLGDGEAEWVKVRVGGRKVNEGFLTNDGNKVRHVMEFPFVVVPQSLAGSENEVLRSHDQVCSASGCIP